MRAPGDPERSAAGDPDLTPASLGEKPGAAPGDTVTPEGQKHQINPVISTKKTRLRDNQKWHIPYIHCTHHCSAPLGAHPKRGRIAI